jgi:hypothetical protein
VEAEEVMPHPTKSEVPQENATAEPYLEYRSIYAWVFQSWLVMFLAVICLALLFYLFPHIQGFWGWITS